MFPDTLIPGAGYKVSLRAQSERSERLRELTPAARRRSERLRELTPAARRRSERLRELTPAARRRGLYLIDKFGLDNDVL